MNRAVNPTAVVVGKTRLELNEHALLHEGLLAGSRIHRPPQIYPGLTERDFISIDRR